MSFETGKIGRAIYKIEDLQAKLELLEEEGADSEYIDYVRNELREAEEAYAELEAELDEGEADCDF